MVPAHRHASNVICHLRVKAPHLARTSGFFQYNANCFGKLFGRALVVDCTVFGPGRCEHSQDVDPLKDVSPSMRAHHDAYQDLAAAAPLLSAPSQGGIARRAFCDLWDLSQSPYHITPALEWRAAATLIRNASLFSSSRGVMIPPGEYMMMQGIPVPSLMDADSLAAEMYPFTMPLEQLFPQASDVRQLAGNGMHVVQVGSVFAILLGMTGQLFRE